MSTIEKGNDVAELSEDIGFLISRTSGVLVQVTNAALADVGLRARSYAVLLLACDTPGGMTQRDLAEVLGLDPSQVVQLVDDLEGAELVKRRPSSADRRTRLVAATRTGQRSRRVAEERVSQAHQQALGALDGDEQATLRDLLSRVLGNGVLGNADSDQASA